MLLLGTFGVFALTTNPSSEFNNSGFDANVVLNTEERDAPVSEMDPAELVRGVLSRMSMSPSPSIGFSNWLTDNAAAFHQHVLAGNPQATLWDAKKEADVLYADYASKVASCTSAQGQWDLKKHHCRIGVEYSLHFNPKLRSMRQAILALKLHNICIPHLIAQKIRSLPE